MIVYKLWEARRYGANQLIPQHRWTREGWFLFGLIPLYVRDVEKRN